LSEGLKETTINLRDEIWVKMQTSRSRSGEAEASLDRAAAQSIIISMSSIPW
jgi:hypothetical protein